MLGFVLSPIIRWRCRPRTDGLPGLRGEVALSPRGAALVARCGMRGTVTLAAERSRLSALLADGAIGDDAFHVVEEELDWAELAAESVLRVERGSCVSTSPR